MYMVTMVVWYKLSIQGRYACKIEYLCQTTMVTLY